VRRHLPFGVPRYACRLRRFERGLNAVRFPADPAWRVRVSGPGKEAPCYRDRVSWAATVPFRDGPFALPPTETLAALPPDGVVLAVLQFENACAPARPRTPTAE
jgi:hypothetical protein